MPKPVHCKYMLEIKQTKQTFVQIIQRKRSTHIFFENKTKILFEERKKIHPNSLQRKEKDPSKYSKEKRKKFHPNSLHRKDKYPPKYSLQCLHSSFMLVQVPVKFNEY